MADYDRSSISQIPMEELEPSPVEETPPATADLEDDSHPVNPEDMVAEKHPSYFPPSSSSSASTTNTIGVRRSRVPQILLAVQKYSVVPPSLYFIMHYANTAVIPLSTLSLQSAEKSLLLTRPYYQSFPLEPLLIFAPIVAHVFSGLSLRLYRRRQAALRYGAETHAERQRIAKALWPKLSLTSALGYTLYPMMVAHVLVNRVTPMKVHGDSSSVGLRFFSHGFRKHPWVAGLGYAFMISVASFHFVGGAAKYLRLSREFVTEGGDYGDRQRTWRDRVIKIVSSVVAGVWMAGGLGIIGRGAGAPAGSAWEVKAWEDVYRSVPLVGGWM